MFDLINILLRIGVPNTTNLVCLSFSDICLMLNAGQCSVQFVWICRKSNGYRMFATFYQYCSRLSISYWTAIHSMIHMTEIISKKKNNDSIEINQFCMCLIRLTMIEESYCDMTCRRLQIFAQSLHKWNICIFCSYSQTVAIFRIFFVVLCCTPNWKCFHFYYSAFFHAFSI